MKGVFVELSLLVVLLLSGCTHDNKKESDIVIATYEDNTAYEKETITDNTATYSEADFINSSQVDMSDYNENLQYNAESYNNTQNNKQFLFRYDEEDGKYDYIFTIDDIALYDIYTDGKREVSLRYGGNEIVLPWVIYTNVAAARGSIEIDKRDVDGDGREELILFTEDYDFQTYYFVYDFDLQKDISPCYVLQEYNESSRVYRPQLYFYSESSIPIAEAINAGLREYGECEEELINIEDGDISVLPSMKMNENNRITVTKSYQTFYTEWECRVVFAFNEKGCYVEDIEMCTRFDRYQRLTDVQTEYTLDRNIYYDAKEREFILEFTGDNVTVTVYGPRAKFYEPVQIQYKGEVIIMEGWWIDSLEDKAYFELKDIDDDGWNELIFYKEKDGQEEVHIFDFESMGETEITETVSAALMKAAS